VILFYKPVKIQYLINILKIHSPRLKKAIWGIPTFEGKPWVVLSKISKLLSFLLIGIFFSSASIGISLVLVYFNSSFWWKLLLPSILLSGIFILLFLQKLQQGNRIYQKFMESVEKRHQDDRSTQISTENIKILNGYLFRVSNYWIKIASLLIIIPLFGLSVYHYQQTNQTKKLSTKPSQSLQRLISLKTKKIKIWQQETNETQKRIKDASKEYVKQYTQLEQAQNAIKFQMQSLYQAQGNRYALEKINQKLKKESPTLAEKETFLRQNIEIYAQAKGILEVNLALKGEDEAQAAGMMEQEGKLYEMFQTLLIRQDNSLYKAQKALLAEKEKKELFEKEVNKHKTLLQTLIGLQDSYCHKKQKTEQDITKLKKQYQLLLKRNQ